MSELDTYLYKVCVCVCVCEEERERRCEVSVVGLGCVEVSWSCGLVGRA